MDSHDTTPYQRIQDEIKNNHDTVLKEVVQGKRIGSYKLGETMGKGAFSEVKLGYHMLTEEKVAAKILEKGRNGTEATLKMMKEEVSLMDKLNHPNIIRLYEVIETLDKFYCFIEYIDGGTLQAFITRKKKAGLRVTEDRCRYFFLQITDAIDHMHTQGIWHRDLKNDNVMLALDNTVKVADFGISTSQSGFLKSRCGTPACMPPELYNREPYEGRWFDIWSLGVLLFQLASATMPFRHTADKTMKDNIKAVEYTIPKHFSAHLADLVSKIFVEKPTERLSIDQIRSHDWMDGEQYRPPLEIADDDECDALEKLRKLGMPDDLIAEASVSAKQGGEPNTASVGTYRIALHQLQMEKMHNMYDGKAARFSLAVGGDDHISEHSEVLDMVEEKSTGCCVLL